MLYEVITDIPALSQPRVEYQTPAVRFSLGRTTTWEELEEVIDLLKKNIPS